MKLPCVRSLAKHNFPSKTRAIPHTSRAALAQITSSGLKRRLHDELVQERGIVQKYPQNQSNVGSSGQTLTTNVSMTLCNWRTCHQNHDLCGCTTFGTELTLGTKLIRFLRLLQLGQGRGYYKGGGGVPRPPLAQAP